MASIGYLGWVSISVLAVNLVVSLVLGHIADYYNPNIKATYSGFVGSILGISLSALLIAVQRFNNYRNLLFYLAIGIIGLSGIAIIFQFLLGFFLAAWACLLWIILGFAFLWFAKAQQGTVKKVNEQFQSKDIPLNEQGPHSNSFSDQNNQIQSQINLDKKNGKCCHRERCCFCCYSCCLVATVLLMIVFTSCSIAYFANVNQFPALGQKIEIEGMGNQKYIIHAYCQGVEQPIRPTIILEHGGGSNSVAFRELGKALSSLNWKLCTYDRLGYGRSSVIPRYLTIQERARITNQVINKLVQNQANKKIIIGGWSAGVELSQIYGSLYPGDVEGMIFMDGYPNYLTLMAIEDNKSEVVPANTLGILQITRIFEPLGIGFIIGSNPISSEQSNQLYRAYYQTGYFWESQYFDVANPRDPTTWLTQASGNASVPYPDAQIKLNWPDISVPMLVMPANETVGKGQYQGMYYRQCEKYLWKCRSPNKEIKIMNGDHGFVLKYPEQTATQIHRFFAPLF